MVKRRTLLLGGAATAGALVIGWGVVPPRQRLHTAQPLPQATGQVALNGWLKVAADNTVTVMMAKSEMGQGAHTGLAARGRPAASCSGATSSTWRPAASPAGQPVICSATGLR